jgi:hypothetical protein
MFEAILLRRKDMLLIIDKKREGGRNIRHVK